MPEEGYYRAAGDESSEPVAPTAAGPILQQSLCSLSSLQHLGVCYHHVRTPGSGFGPALPQLTQLTYLKACVEALNIRAWREHLSCLTNLRVLVLCGADSEDEREPMDESILQGVQHLQQLTKVQFGGDGYTSVNIKISSDTRSTLGQLTSLQCLSLRYIECDLEAFSAVTGLHSLSLQACGCGHGYFSQGPVALSKHKLQSWLLRQHQLTYLALGDSYPLLDESWDLPLIGEPDDPRGHIDFEDEEEYQYKDEQGNFDFAAWDQQQPAPGSVPGMEVFGAFTASSCLQCLDLSQAALQHNAFQHIFPADRQLPQLTSLLLPKELYEPRDEYTGLLLKPADVRAMVACCPALRDLSGGELLHFRPELSMLQGLTRLQARWGSPPHINVYWMNTSNYFYAMRVFRNLPVNTLEASQALAALTNLQELLLYSHEPWGECFFTALRQLSKLTTLSLTAAPSVQLSDEEGSLLAQVKELTRSRVVACGAKTP